MDNFQEEQKSDSLTFVRSLIVLGVVIVAAIALAPTVLDTVQEFTPTETVTVECVIGSEKSGFLSNPQVQQILADDYGITVSFRREGSYEQVMSRPQGVDCLWPSNTSAVEIFEERYPDVSFSDAIIFNSPIVLYSWQPVTDPLIDARLIRTVTDDTAYLEADTFEVMEMLTSDERPAWSNLGIEALFGNFNIITTDPTRSNSGNMFYALLANILNGGNVATASSIEPHLPIIDAYYERQGRLESSSGTLFEQFTIQGYGAFPIIANYESLLIELSAQNPDDAERIAEQIRIIYLNPTVWSSHPLMALNDNGDRLLEAVQDERLQRIAWEQHGFRSGLAGVQNDASVFSITGLNPTVTSVLPLPRSAAILEMLDMLEN